MRILYLCHRLPDAPDKGCKIRAFHLLRGLAARHEVHVRALVDHPDQLPGTGALDAFCTSVEAFPLHRTSALLRCLGGLAGGRPATLDYFHSPALERSCAELGRRLRFDLVVIYSSAMAPYAEQLPGVPRLLDMVDVDSAKWAQYARLGALPLRPGYALEATRLRRYEAAIAARVERVVVVTDREAELLAAIAPSAAIASIPNGIDGEHFAALDLPKSVAPSLVFTGQMDYFANVDAVVTFARGTLPRLRRRFPDLELVVVGRSPTSRVRGLGDLPGVTVTGAVEDVRPFLARAWAFVAPLRIAQGLQNKVLEAMAAGLPVACSDRTLQGLGDGGFVPGEDLLVAPAEELAGPLEALLADAGLRRRLAAAAGPKVRASYSWERSLVFFEAACLRAARQLPRSPAAVGGLAPRPWPRPPARATAAAAPAPRPVHADRSPGDRVAAIRRSPPA